MSARANARDLAGTGRLGTAAPDFSELGVILGGTAGFVRADHAQNATTAAMEPSRRRTEFKIMFEHYSLPAADDELATLTFLVTGLRVAPGNDGVRLAGVDWAGERQSRGLFRGRRIPASLTMQDVRECITSIARGREPTVGALRWYAALCWVPAESAA